MANTDIALVCPDGRQLLCHQVVLAASSRRFANALQQGQYTGQRLPVQGVDSNALEAVVSSFYTGECAVTVSTVAAIFDAAAKLEVATLTDACQRFVEANISVDDCCTLLDSTMEFKATPLSTICLDFIAKRFSDVVASQDFLSASYPVVLEILQDNLERQPAATVLKAAASWLGHDPSRAAVRAKLLGALGVPGVNHADVIDGRSSAPEQAAAEEQPTMQQSPTHEAAYSRSPSPTPASHQRTPPPPIAQQLQAAAAAAAAMNGSHSGLPNSTNAIVANAAAQLASQLGPAAALQAANVLAATAMQYMGLPRSNAPPHLVPHVPPAHLVHVLPSGQLQALSPGLVLPPGIHSMHGPPGLHPLHHQLPPMKGLNPQGLMPAYMPSGRPMSPPGPGMGALDALTALSHAVAAASSARTTEGGSPQTVWRPTALSPRPHFFGGAPHNGNGHVSEAPPPRRAGQQRSPTGSRKRSGHNSPEASVAGATQTWDVNDGGGVLALAAAAAHEQELERARHQQSHGGGRRATFSNGTLMQPGSGKRKPDKSASANDVMLGSGTATKRRRASSGSTPSFMSGGMAHLVDDGHGEPGEGVAEASGLPGRLFDHTPATSIATAVLELDRKSNGAPCKKGGTAARMSEEEAAAATKEGGEEEQGEVLVAGRGAGRRFAGHLGHDRLKELLSGAASQRPASPRGSEETEDLQVGDNNAHDSATAAAAAAAAGGAAAPAISRQAALNLLGLSRNPKPETSQRAYMDPAIRVSQNRQPLQLPAPPVLKGVCHVDNCYADLTNLREYHLRYKICEYHLKASSIMKDGIPQRFCQQCGRFHSLEAFDGTRRSCRAMLQRHNARRAKKSSEAAQQAQALKNAQQQQAKAEAM